MKNELKESFTTTSVLISTFIATYLITFFLMIGINHLATLCGSPLTLSFWETLGVLIVSKLSMD